MVYISPLEAVFAGTQAEFEQMHPGLYFWTNETVRGVPSLEVALDAVLSGRSLEGIGRAARREIEGKLFEAQMKVLEPTYEDVYAASDPRPSGQEIAELNRFHDYRGLLKPFNSGLVIAAGLLHNRDKRDINPEFLRMSDGSPRLLEAIPNNAYVIAVTADGGSLAIVNRPQGRLDKWLAAFGNYIEANIASCDEHGQVSHGRDIGYAADFAMAALGFTAALERAAQGSLLEPYIERGYLVTGLPRTVLVGEWLLNKGLDAPLKYHPVNPGMEEHVAGILAQKAGS
ncbi:hypothetical protein HYV82_02400 [Candidatus Woesearchaeota archaeon]|nr:hypothetical protein [Candidatus Woesearchaeota archaeon]